MIMCENNFCIYNRERKCTLESISLSAWGLCDDAIIPNIDAQVLDKYKKEVLARQEQR